MGYWQYQHRRYYRWVSGTTAGAFFEEVKSRWRGSFLTFPSTHDPPTRKVPLCSRHHHTSSLEASPPAWITPLRPEGGSRTISPLFFYTMSSGKVSPLPLNLVDSLRCVGVQIFCSSSVRGHRNELVLGIGSTLQSFVGRFQRSGWYREVNRQIWSQWYYRCCGGTTGTTAALPLDLGSSKTGQYGCYSF